MQGEAPGPGAMEGTFTKLPFKYIEMYLGVLWPMVLNGILHYHWEYNSIEWYSMVLSGIPQYLLEKKQRGSYESDYQYRCL